MSKDKLDQHYDKGLKFTCEQCSYCCRNEPGFVFLSENDMQALLEETKLSRQEFIDTYCKIADLGVEKRISIKEKPNNDCVFWEEKGCSVYKSRPLQCRSYPFWPMIVETKTTWEDEKKYCPGIGKGTTHSKELIEAWLEKRLHETLISE